MPQTPRQDWLLGLRMARLPKKYELVLPATWASTPLPLWPLLMSEVTWAPSPSLPAPVLPPWPLLSSTTPESVISLPLLLLDSIVLSSPRMVMSVLARLFLTTTWMLSAPWMFPAPPSLTILPTPGHPPSRPTTSSPPMALAFSPGVPSLVWLLVTSTGSRPMAPLFPRTLP